MSENNAISNYDVMNGNNAMNGNYGMKEEQVRELVVGREAVETNAEVSPVPQSPAPEVEVSGPLAWLRTDQVIELKSRWISIQAQFVDEPHKSVEQADALVSDTLGRIEKIFSDKRESLEQKWINQAEISTEDLRTALQGYRAFFNRLLDL